MRIFVTAGNTQVPIDRVRCITNIFTGRTGAAIALEAYRRGHRVTLATSHAEIIDHTKLDPARWQCLTYRTFDDLEDLMTAQIAFAFQDAVVHCAAVSDYLCDGIYASPTGKPLDRSAGKVKSDEPELWLRLRRLPKLVDKIRTPWDFHGLLVKFKLEVGLSEEDLLSIAEQARQQSSADWMVANTLEGAAEWALVGNAHGYKKVPRAELSGALLDVLESEAAHG